MGVDGTNLVQQALFTTHTDFIYTIIGLLFVANFLVLIIGLLGSNVFSRITLIRKQIIWAAVILFSIVGTYALQNSYFDVWVMTVCGIIGFFLRKLDFPLAPFILAIILGKMAESNMIRSLALSDGSAAIFISRPISFLLIFLAVISLFWPLLKKGYQAIRTKKQFPLDK